jgi:predicted transglutaminase-like cysteine proteinase
MRRSSKALLVTAVAAAVAQQPAQANVQALPRGLKMQLERLQFIAPTLAPMAHTRFCLQYAEECEVRRIAFRRPALELTSGRWAELVEVNSMVNRMIKPMRTHAGLAGEEWLLHPKAGDCNDYAVSKRQQLLKRGWPSHALLLAEVAIPSGGHHLTLVLRTREGDFVLDNLAANIRPWSSTRYQWLRMQSPKNPRFWTTVAAGPSRDNAKPSRIAPLPLLSQLRGSLRD